MLGLEQALPVHPTIEDKDKVWAESNILVIIFKPL
jgi:hypothetical protein